MKKDDINLFEAYSQVVCSKQEQLDEAGKIARTATRLGALGSALSQGYKSAVEGGGVGFKKTYQMGKQSSILSKLADDTIKNIQALGLVPMKGKRFTPEDKNELIGLMTKFIEDRGGMSSTGQEGDATAGETPVADSIVSVGKNKYTFNGDSNKWEYAYVDAKGKPTGTTTEIKGGPEVQQKLTDAWRKSQSDKVSQYQPEFSQSASTSPQGTTVR